MDSAKLLAWRFHRQHLDGAGCSSAAESLARCGWARSVGGAAPYLGFFSRAGSRRAAVDEALKNVELHELPCARSCTYIVAPGDYALALKSGEPFADNEMKVARKVGVTDAEIDKLGAAVLQALGKVPMDPDGLKSALGAKVRNLGEEGKKKGITTTLPLALGRLQSMGEIRRIPVNGRLDQQRYQYAAWRPNPLAKCKLSQEEVFTELARRYFQWIGPASLAEFQWFSGLGVKAAKLAIEPLKLKVSGEGGLLPVELSDEFATFQPPKEPRYALVSGIDSAILLRRDVGGMLEDSERANLVQGERGPVELGRLSDLPSHAILDRGRLVGLWEYDTETQSIAWATFGKAGATLKKAVQSMESFVREDLGDARAFSLDSPKSRAPRIAALRTAAAP